jgi:alkanesulfonate monooxygenase SsuD/methylene tetrahydromethanopterin reductase-like flavin-dependent oxidoreductase (luciferase family)
VAGYPTTVDGEKVTLAPGATMPPILIGGGPAAMRRAAQHGYGWYPAFLPPTNLAEAIKEFTEQTGQQPEVTAQVAMALGNLSSEQIDAQAKMLTNYGMPEEQARQSMLTGNREQAANHLATLFAAGANRVVGLPLTGGNHQQAELLAEAVQLVR